MRHYVNFLSIIPAQNVIMWIKQKVMWLWRTLSIQTRQFVNEIL